MDAQIPHSIGYQASLQMNTSRQCIVMNQNPIINNFTDSCLSDIRTKLQSLPQLQGDAIEQLQYLADLKVDSISKVFLDLEDLIVKLLRKHIKALFEQTQKMLLDELSRLQVDIHAKISGMQAELLEMEEKISHSLAGSKKLLGRFAQGKVEENFQKFKSNVLDLQLSAQQIEYNEEELEELVSDIMDILNVKFKPQAESRTSQYQSANYSPERQKSVKGIRQKSVKGIRQKSVKGIRQKSVKGIRNDSIISRMISELPKEENKCGGSRIEKQLEREDEKEQLEREDEKEQYEGNSAIQQHKETKTIKRKQKMVKMEQKVQTKALSTIAKLALEKQRLLKQLESNL